jgi:hypothetical protein
VVLSLLAAFVGVAALAEPARGMKLGYHVASPGDVHQLGLAAAGGATHVRVGALWSEIEPTPGEYHWDGLDDLDAAITGAGLRPMFVVSAAPCWAQEFEQCDGAGPRSSSSIELRHPSEFPPGVAAWPLPEEIRPQYLPDSHHLAEWREFVRRVAARYPHAILQIWNEPNLDIFCSPICRPARYVRVLKQAHLGAQDAAFPGPLIGAGLAPVLRQHPHAYARRLRRHGVGRWVDAMGVHFFPVLRSNVQESWGDAAARYVRRQREALRVPVWVTEIGVWGTERTQARGFGDIWRRLERLAEVRAATVYQLADTAGTTFPRSGVLHADYDPKLAWFRLRNLTRDARSLGR